ncbi:MAG: XkdF-like putative serine protease domain-containing protein [Alistipes sp.]|nr:XkdF-like putative serine protease domain-containing protein [Alistipes sp.]
MNEKVKKAFEITDAKISFVSLVDKAANKRQFLITKAKDGKAEWNTVGRIVKTDSSNHYVTGVVYEPLVEDAHGDFMTEEEITKAAYWFAKNGSGTDIQHSFEAEEGVSVVENWIAKADFEINGESISKGTWLITAEVQNDEIWDKISKGEITGFSMGGQGKYSKKDVDLDDLKKNDGAEDKQGLLAKFAKMIGLKAIKKGEVTEIYNERSKSACFWEALNALEQCLYEYDWNTGRRTFESDERIIREALSDFSEIITDILISDSITKAISPDFEQLEKAGKKMSGRNKQTLCGIYDSLGAFLKEFDDPETENADTDNNSEEESEVTKSEVEKLIADGIAKALENATKSPEPAETVEKSADNTAVTAEFIETAVQEAVKKALESEQPKPETVTAEQVEKMIGDAVAKAIEPIRKQTGLPTNLNDDKTVEKQAEQHYLHGIL